MADQNIPVAASHEAVPAAHRERFFKYYLPTELLADLCAAMRDKPFNCSFVDADRAFETGHWFTPLYGLIQQLDRQLTIDRVGESVQYVLMFPSDCPAFATRLGKRFVIALDVGLLIRCYQYASALVFSEPYCEIFGLNGHAPHFMRDRSVAPMRIHDPNALAGLPPQTDFSRGSISALTTQALLFVGAHETTHITHGHLSVSELIAEGSFRPVDPLTSQTLEWDADAAAIDQALQDFVFGERDEAGKLIFRKGTQVILLGTLLGLKVLESLDPDRQPLSERKHLPSSWRTFGAIVRASDFLAHKAPTVSDVKEFVCRTNQILEDSLKCAVALPSKFPGFMSAEFLESVAHMDLVGRRYSELLPELERHKLGETRLAPVQFTFGELPYEAVGRIVRDLRGR